MARAVRMPPLGETSEQLRLLRWLKKPGEAVRQGEPLLEIETDKATLEVEAAVSGTLLSVLHGPGDVVAVGEALAYVGEPGEEPPPADAPAAPSGGRRQAVPAARRLAQEHGLDLAAVPGSGPGGRIEKADVLALVEAAPAPVGELPVSRHRRALAERLTRSAATVPQFSVGVDVDLSRASELLARERAAGLAGLTLTHLVLRAAAAALREHPELNRVWVADGPRLRQLEQADVGLAVAGEETLQVAAVPEPDLLDLPALAAAAGEAGRRAREGTVAARPVALTVSNLGMHGVDRVTALVDPDQAAILAVGAVRERVLPAGGELRVVPAAELTLTVDHRVADGVLAARFLASVRDRLERGEP